MLTKIQRTTILRFRYIHGWIRIICYHFTSNLSCRVYYVLEGQRVSRDGRITSRVECNFWRNLIEVIPLGSYGLVGSGETAYGRVSMFTQH